MATATAPDSEIKIKIGKMIFYITAAIGLWFFADLTLGMDMPAVAWRDIWPLGLILLGLAVLIRGMASRRA